MLRILSLVLQHKTPALGRGSNSDRRIIIRRPSATSLACCASLNYKTPANARVSNGGRDRDRTDDLLVANEALSQLSYTPDKSVLLFHRNYDLFIIAYPEIERKFYFYPSDSASSCQSKFILKEPSSLRIKSALFQRLSPSDIKEYNSSI